MCEIVGFTSNEARSFRPMDGNLFFNNLQLSEPSVSDGQALGGMADRHVAGLLIRTGVSE